MRKNTKAARAQPHSSPSPFEFGVIAFIDALGWKGMWRRPGVDARAMLAALSALREETKPVAARIRAALDQLNHIPGSARPIFPGVSVRALSLSDTLVVAATLGQQANPADEYRDNLYGPTLQRAVMDVVLHAYQVAALGAPPLALRGAVAVGELLVQEDFFVGPAVDRCAELMNLAEAACVFLDPAAPTWDSDHCFDFELELKGIGRLTVPVLNPVGGCSLARAEAIKKGIVRAFGNHSDLSVLKKLENTLAVFHRARQQQEPTDTPETRMEAVLSAADYAEHRAGSSSSPRGRASRRGK